MLAGKYGTKCKHVQKTPENGTLWNTLTIFIFWAMIGVLWKCLKMSRI